MEIAVDVEKMRLEPRHQTAHRTFEADIGDAVDGAAVQWVVAAVARHAHRVDRRARAAKHSPRPILAVGKPIVRPR